ncbi:GNAT family N-acetyltransferase [Gemmata sp. G18]|uniref:GNAT family N-acetyltransferase n=1 Tax=Gemmata palustris TaxID=2822762 RepID=A0ABS5C4B1_9BACT|nr:GNAT family N-acetyltransferase [Gemmata palustris]MBP3960826.1 GNAT family N-acetyltransferase [Gemmata palustris]
MANVKYFKRHRMELALGHPLPRVDLPSGFSWLGWDDSLLDRHAEVKFACFRNETDSLVFPSLGSRTGCRDLMAAIRYRPDFCPQATWLLSGPDGLAGTVQGLFDENRFGGIQNLGVVPEYRGLRLGRALLLQALSGFLSVGVRRAFLEVTATNGPAVHTYRAIGFRSCKTLYRAVELPHPDTVSVGL